MEAFDTLTGIAAALPMADIDTDRILPAAFLTTVTRTGLGRHLFHPLRYDATGGEQADFVLNREPWRRACILVTRENFGSGSSREHAPWALLDFGVRCVIAPGFADIFRNNCVRNGILTAEVAPRTCERLLALASNAATATMTVDLGARRITDATGAAHLFTIDDSAARRLLAAEDEIAVTQGHEPTITAYERRAREARPWLFTDAVRQAIGARRR